MQILPVTAKRAALERFKRFLGLENGVDVSAGSFVNEKTIIMEQVLNASTGTYQFKPVIGQGAAQGAVSEILMTQNDKFFVYGISLGIKKRRTDVPQTTQNIGNYPIFTYVDNTYFITPGATGVSEADALRTLFSGELDFQTGNIVRFDKLSTDHLQYVPVRQYETSAMSGGEEVFPVYGASIEERGFFLAEPNLIIDGMEQNSITLRLGAGDRANIAGAVDPNGDPCENIVVLRLHGWNFNTSNNAQAQPCNNQL